MKVTLLLATILVSPAIAKTWVANPDNYAQIMSSLESGDSVHWADPLKVVPEYYDRTARRFDPPIEIDYGSAIVRPQRFTNLDGAVFRGGYFKNELRTKETGLMVGRSAANIKLLGLSFYGGRNGVTLASARNIYAENIICDSMGSDCMDVTNVVNLEVRGLKCFGDSMIPGSHPDCFQTWARFGEVAPFNLSFDNVYCEGSIQCISDFVHVSPKARPLGPDPVPDKVRITNLVVYGATGWAIGFRTCGKDCTAENVLVIPGKTATYLPNTLITKKINVVIEPLGSKRAVPMWRPSSERYPRHGKK